tara:strand:+ start:91 stop:891 length:801 start_codon:yes stop_codon:yes gene_type:complete
MKVPEIKPEDIGWKFIPGTDTDVWGSLIIKKDGRESDFWDSEANGFRAPDTLPNGWISDEAIYEDGTPIPSAILSQQLKLNQKPNNWERAIEAARALRGKTIDASPSDAFVQPGTPDYKPVSTIFNDSPKYGEESPAYKPSNDSPQYGLDTPEYKPSDDSPQYGQDSPEYIPDDDSPGYKFGATDTIEKVGDDEGKAGITIQENLAGVKDRILNIIDVSKNSILDIDKEPDEKRDEKKTENNNSSSDGVKIIASDLTDTSFTDKMG